MKQTLAAAFLCLAGSTVSAAAATQALDFNVTLENTYLSCLAYCSSPPEEDESRFWGFEMGETGIARMFLTDLPSGQTQITFGSKGQVWFDYAVSAVGGTFSHGETVSSGIGLNISWDGASGFFKYEDDSSPYFRVAEFSFGDPQPAPVPLPASIALFPMVVGAFSVLHRRKSKLGRERIVSARQ